MKCTCKDWDILDNEHSEIASSELGYKFCPWCGSPLLPDAVERTEWAVLSHSGVTLIDVVNGIDDEKKANCVLNDKAAAYPQSTHTLESVTTIERVHKIVRAKT